MNAANINTSKRLQRVWTLLNSGGRYSTMDIIQQANVCAVSTIVGELRRNGKQINCQREGNTWWYSC